MPLKLLSWNVNGIRSVLKKGFEDFIKQEDPSVMCLQEIKAHPEQVDVLFPQYHLFWNSGMKRGYSGTAVFTKQKPLGVTYGMGQAEHDQEGRVITLEFVDYYLINVYTPNAQRGLTRLSYRKKWDQDFLHYLKQLEKKKPVIFCGDLNVAHQEIDLKNPEANRRNAGFTDEERAGFSRILSAGFIDTFRDYSWWTYRFNARARNIGWRIDYFCLSKSLRPRLQKAFILSQVMGSDHAPVGIFL